MSSRVHVPDFRAAQTVDEIAQYCGATAELFDTVTSDPSRQRFYIRHEIPKRRKRPAMGTRTVWEVPDGPLRDVHKTLARRFDLFARLVEPRYPNEFAFGYVRGRGTQKNAKTHCGAPLLLRADIKNFFPTRTTARLQRVFMQLGITRICAASLATFCTVNDQLALGFHASPLFANLVCLDLDRQLSELSAALGCVYTRYADDMTFSGAGPLPTRERLTQIVEAAGFNLSTSKFRLTKLGQAHYVTGLSVSDGADPHAPRAMKRRLRLELYYAKKYGLEQHLGRRSEQSFQAGVNRIDGLVRYVSGIEHAKRQALRDSWKSILNACHSRPSYMPVEARAFRSIAFVIDEGEFSRGDTKYLGMACATTEDLEKIRISVAAMAREYRADPFAPGRPKKVDTKGLHFADVPETVRDNVVKMLSFQPFRGYVAFAPYDGSKEYAALYLELLKTLLVRRFQAADRAEVTLFVEENPRIPPHDIQEVVGTVYLSLETANNRRPFELPTLKIARKTQNHELVMPDFMLGTLAHYLDLHSERTELQRLRFERLRDKVRVVLDLERHIEFSRRRPLLPWSTPTQAKQ
jgi:retron-type reverse transcriptase